MGLRYLHRTHRRRKPGARRHRFHTLYRLLFRSASNSSMLTPSTPGAPLFALTFSHACMTAHFEISNGLPGDFNSFTRLLPNPNGFWLIQRTQSQMTRSLGSTPITRASSLLRTGPPTEPATVLTPQQTPGLLPLAHCTQNQTGSIGSGLLTFRVGAADRARVASMPDTAWPINGHPPSSSRDKGHTPVLMPSISFDTSTANRLRSPSRSLPSASRALFPHRSPRSRHRSRSMWRFEAFPPQGDFEEPTFISHTAPHQQAPPTSNSPLCS